MRATYGTMNAPKITDMDLQALIDGQLEDGEAVRIREALKKDPALQNRYMLYQKQKQLLKKWWKDN